MLPVSAKSLRPAAGFPARIVGRGFRGRAGAGRRDAEQFHVENQHRVRSDIGTGATFAISEFCRHKELIFRADLHQLKRFGPALDDPIHWETKPVFRACRNCRTPCRRSSSRDN